MAGLIFMWAGFNGLPQLYPDVTYLTHDDGGRTLEYITLQDSPAVCYTPVNSLRPTGVQYVHQQPRRG